MQELNNLKIIDLPKVFKKETLTESYWSLINNAQTNCKKLHDARIKYSDDLFEIIKHPENTAKIIKTTGISNDYLNSLNGVLLFHSFKPAPLKKIEGINPQYIKALEASGIKNTGTLLLAGKTVKERIKLARTAGIPVSEINKLFVIADLMRKPGIKSTKVKLFTAVGITSLNNLGKQDPQLFRLQLEKFIKKTGIVKAIPTPKEVVSDIVWAGIYPKVVEL